MATVNYLKYWVGPTAITLRDSYQVSKIHFERQLLRIRNLYPTHAIFAARSMGSLKREWAGHNALYALGIKRSRTRDCDLEYPQQWHVKVAWDVLGFLAWPWIK